MVLAAILGEIVGRHRFIPPTGSSLVGALFF
jgi:hypothetical protein